MVKSDKSIYKAFGHKVSIIPWNGTQIIFELNWTLTPCKFVFLFPLETNFTGYKCENNEIVTIEASCITGFECAAAEEVQSKLGVEDVKEFTGRVLFDIDPAKIEKVLKLRTVDNIWVIIGARTDFDFSKSEEESYEMLTDYTLNKLLWSKGLKTWNSIFVSIQ